MRIALIGPPADPVSRLAGGSNTLLERLVDGLQEAGHEVVLSASGALPADLYVQLTCDADGNVTGATVAQVRPACSYRRADGHRPVISARDRRGSVV